MIKINNLIAVCYDKKNLILNMMRKSSNLLDLPVRSKGDLKYREETKILYMLYKSAYLNLKDKSNDPFTPNKSLKILTSSKCIEWYLF